MEHRFLGFGFGPIQSGLFVREAAESGVFSDVAVVEIDAALVAAIRANGNRYSLNIASPDGLAVVEVAGVRMLNPNDPRDQAELEEASRCATEITTALPSVAFYAAGANAGVAGCIARGLAVKNGPPCIVYTAENNTTAAEQLDVAVHAALPTGTNLRPVEFLNTVIGKMSQTVTDPDDIRRRNLAPVVPGYPRAFLVESFNRILISKITLPGFTPAITSFVEKEDLKPFEEAKLYGHNAVHALLGFFARAAGIESFSALRDHASIMALARRAFIDEIGTAFIRKYKMEPDALFTPAGFRQYADDLLERMTCPYLNDSVERAIRDPERKLGVDDRLFGAMRLCLEQGVEPLALAEGAFAGLQMVSSGDTLKSASGIRTVLQRLWRDQADHPCLDAMVNCLQFAAQKMKEIKK